MIKSDKLNVDLLSKEDLIRIIAGMHDVIQDWGNGYGLSPDDAQTLIKVGESSRVWCHKNGWKYDINHAIVSPIEK